MDNRFNTAAGWVLFSGIIALGLSSISSRVFHSERPEEMGYPVEVADAGGAAGGEMSMAEALTMPGVDASAGEKIFAKCVACHTINQGGADGIGPNLWGVMGKPVGKHASGFAYSTALPAVGGDWGWDNMNVWLKSPRAFANGTKMSFAGLSKIEDRAAVIMYLNANGSNLPVPEFVAAAAAPAEGVDGADEGPGVVDGANPDAVEAAGGMGAAQPVAADTVTGE